MEDVSSEVGLPGASGWKVGFSLPQDYYLDPKIFEDDLEILGQEGWILIDHGSRIPNGGDFFTVEFGKESIIVLRARGGEVKAFYNVCRHRGSRICLEQQGNKKSLICPYHAWTYDLNGKLRGAPLMPEGFDKNDYGLNPCHVREQDRLIFINLSTGITPDFDALREEIAGSLTLHGIADAKIAVRRIYPTMANWKLAVENFCECYHCKPSHATYCSVHEASKLLALGAGFGSSDEALTAAYMPAYDEWAREANAKGYPTDSNRAPIGPGMLTESADGQPVSKLMGQFKDYDGGMTGVGSGNWSSLMMAANDFAVIFRFIPRSPVETDVEAIWLVDGTAQEGVDYDVERLTHVWDVTLREDKKITEDNQRGVLSKMYRPGPYSRQETMLTMFTQWYATRVQALRLHRLQTAGEFEKSDQ